ncbi:hypothetical protein BHM03_00039048 [Ensete ventricosum]|nr:hypothetical protein BHM03_00039048 [Ensete ventricosum]
MSSSGSSYVGIIPPVSSKGTRSEGPEASVSRSSSSGILAPLDAKSLRDLEVMKSCHDIVSIISEESLVSIRECYSIPEEYTLWAPLPEQRPYNPRSSEISISMNVLEVGLCFPLHPTIMECLRYGEFLQVKRRPTHGATLLRFSYMTAPTTDFFEVPGSSDGAASVLYCRSIGASGLMVVLAEARSLSVVHSTWKRCDVAE